jgi:hypothetical protein
LINKTKTTLACIKGAGLINTVRYIRDHQHILELTNIDKGWPTQLDD